MSFNTTKLTSKLNKLLKDYTDNKLESKDIVNGVVFGVSSKDKTEYLKAGGVSNVDTNKELDEDIVMSIFSLTKALTATAILVLYDQGKLDINKPAAEYLPQIGDILLIDAGDINEDGTFKKPPRPSKSTITVKNLLNHTSGFGYSSVNEEYLRLDGGDMFKVLLTPSKEHFTTAKMPLLFEAGTRFNYSHSADWLGLIVKAISGQLLGDFLKSNVFDKVGMTKSTFDLNQVAHNFPVHMRGEDGTISVHPSFNFDRRGEIHMGGHGCFSTVSDWLKFIRVWLNQGTSPDTGYNLLKPETVELAIQNHLGPNVQIEFPLAENEAVQENALGFGFTIAGMAYSLSDLKTGRPAGSTNWTGMSNIYFWIDFKNKIGGMFGAQLLPYLDPISVEAFNKMELAVYESLEK